MKVFAVALAIVLAAGCLSSPAPAKPADAAGAPSEAHAAGLAAVDAPPQPGLYDLSPEGGLRKVDGLPGLMSTTKGNETHYFQDVTQILLRNADPVLLVQALEEQVVTASYDVDMAYRPKTPVGDPRGSDAICMGTFVDWGHNEGSFYFDRAAGHAGTPPAPDTNGNYGGGNGHGRAGPIYAIEQLFGPRFQESDRFSSRLLAGTYMRLSNPLSQYPPEEAKTEGNFWFQNFTMTGAHRVIRIPPAPIFCFSGFSEFEGVQVVGLAPYQVARDGHIAIETRYGATAMLNWEPVGYPPHDLEPTNAASVTFAGTTCNAGAGKTAVLHTFDAGLLESSVAQWTGYPTVVLMGLGPQQGIWNYRVPDECH